MIISLQLLVNDWVNETFTNHGEFCEHYPVQCSADTIRICGYKIATINDDHVVFHECQFMKGSTKDVILHAGDPKFFLKLRGRINRRMKYGIA